MSFTSLGDYNEFQRDIMKRAGSSLSYDIGLPTVEQRRAKRDIWYERVKDMFKVHKSRKTCMMPYPENIERMLTIPYDYMALMDISRRLANLTPELYDKISHMFDINMVIFGKAAKRHSLSSSIGTPINKLKRSCAISSTLLMLRTKGISLFQYHFRIVNFGDKHIMIGEPSSDVTLYDLLEEDSFSSRDLSHIIIQVMMGLYYALMDYGFIHRDISSHQLYCKKMDIPVKMIFPNGLEIITNYVVMLKDYTDAQMEADNKDFTSMFMFLMQTLFGSNIINKRNKNILLTFLDPFVKDVDNADDKEVKSALYEFKFSNRHEMPVDPRDYVNYVIRELLPTPEDTEYVPYYPTKESRDMVISNKLN